MKYVTLVRENMKKHKGSFIGIFLLMFIITVSLSSVLSIWNNSGSYVSDEMERIQYGDLIYWMNNNGKKIDKIVESMEAVDGVDKVVKEDNAIIKIVIDGEEVPYVSSGYPAKDENGNFIYDENGNVKKRLFSIEQVKLDNAMFNIESSGLPVFKIALEFKLTDEGFKITIPRESLLDSTNVSKDHPDYKMINGGYQIYSVSLCPYMTYVDTTQEGYIIVM